jgi:2-polyprenyl-6-methoxyphenol hydroxylase-like FAD-dependent oxidoreductase
MCEYRLSFGRYYVPRDGDPNSDKRDFVWIWYDTLPDPQQLTATLTDVSGKVHQTTVPRGKMSPEVWQRVVGRKTSVMNPHFIDLMESIEEPFVSAISDFQGHKSLFYDNKLMLVGDAFALCRPHGGGSTSQAAFQAHTLLRSLQGEISIEQWQETCLESAEKAARFSLAMADFFWNGKVSQSVSNATLSKPNAGDQASPGDSK